MKFLKFTITFALLLVVNFYVSGKSVDNNINSNETIELPSISLSSESANRFNSFELKGHSTKSIDDLTEAFFDVATLKKIFPLVDKIEVLAKDDNEMTLHIDFDLPFPLKDRCIYVVIKKEVISKSETIVTIKDTTPIGSKKCRKKLFNQFDSTISIQSVDNETTVTQNIYLDPGGKIPASLFNSKLEEELPKLLASIL